MGSTTFEHDENTTAPAAVNLSISGGTNFAASAWLNEHYLGSSFVPRSPTNNESFPVSGDMLVNETNYVTVLQESHGTQSRLVGRDETQQFTSWKVVGNLGGEDFPDKMRKILNEGKMKLC
ncbi:hypothetical protein VKT23_014670 [Stygiomarasmius scandens]|uniref:Beta-galactosidase jelly roll domain-containing protein n=1 Tax=Marasmiellus scandens TaxID=2682957 RepID=A0ABR1J4K3_9AGAR